MDNLSIKCGGRYKLSQNWIQYDKCQRWLHQSCSNLSADMLKEHDDKEELQRCFDSD
ncbi:hypothetical protein NP493_1733g00050 [Ridgeia piscesae]|uniref:Uncharacterized protein n=1 Tax=Ridgeia piscesae TaxID=27915 RepID=A0AAD9N9I7_RIDPI|nr:hypothetical protein NP493_1733g00050 [Ridgeia piscesae]